MGAIAFVATLVLLAGLALGISGRVPGSSPGPSASGVGVGSGSSPGAPSPGSTAESQSPGSQPSASAPASPAPTASTSGAPVLVGAGDIASCDLDGDEATARLLDGIPGTVFTAGDNAYDNGSTKDYAECYGPSWGRHKDRTRPAVGNHEYQTQGAVGYKEYFGRAAIRDGKTWYSYDLETWHVIVLDSNCAAAGGCDAGSDQGRWLAADLAASKATCTLAIWHHPRFTSGEHGDDPAVGPFWDALYTAGADVVINGHDHDYERFAPQSPDGASDPSRGIREFVVGTGGAAIRGFPRVAANSQLRVALTHGVIKMTLHPGKYEWIWLPTTGTVSDSGNAPCH